MEECYMCDQEATTKEHVPPKCFFPKGHRAGLITVPSCAIHNNDNSMDVEYVRNILVQHHHVNQLAIDHAQSTATRSMIRRPQLARTTFASLRPVLMSDGQETGVFQVDLERLKRVMSAMAYALYFHVFGKQYRRCWNCFSNGLHSTGSLYGEVSEAFLQQRKMFSSLTYCDLQMSQPDVFCCGLSGSDPSEYSTDLVFHFRFYDGFDAFVFTAPC
ncbi:MAG: hypothetical protein JWL77_2130 [Chthonomonadaceae bacterium]|nr:hypothetical protein [Chthonomonadaceae bacterium]